MQDELKFKESKRYHIIKSTPMQNLRRDRPKFLPHLRDSLFETQSSDITWLDDTEIAEASRLNSNNESMIWIDTCSVRISGRKTCTSTDNHSHPPMWAIIYEH